MLSFRKETIFRFGVQQNMAARYESASCSVVGDGNGSEEFKILVIGEMGKGKSSMIGGVGGVDTNGNKPKIGYGSGGETKECDSFVLSNMAFTDTCGLGELCNGTVPTEKVLFQLADLYLNNKEGFHLAMYVLNDLKTTNANNVRTLEIYDILLGKKNIPFVLVCTSKPYRAGESIEENVIKEWSKIRPIVSGLYVDFADIESTNDSHDREHIKQKTAKSVEGIKGLISRHSSEPTPLYHDNDWKTPFLLKLNDICLKYGWSYFLYGNQSIIKMLVMCDDKHNRARAKVAAAKIYNQLHKNKALPPSTDNLREEESQTILFE